jgi:hypothetical protein
MTSLQVAVEINGNKRIKYSSEKNELLRLLEREHKSLQMAQAKMHEDANEISVMSSAMRMVRQKEVEQSLENSAYSVTAEEISRIADRLAEAERRSVILGRLSHLLCLSVSFPNNQCNLQSAIYRTMDASVQGAKSYTQNARNIAYLEGKLSKLTALVDHYRYLLHMKYAFSEFFSCDLHMKYAFSKFFSCDLHMKYAFSKSISLLCHFHLLFVNLSNTITRSLE